MIEVPYVDISSQWHDERNELIPILDTVLETGQYVGGSEVENFEREAALLFEVDHVVALNSGTDALVCGLAAIGIGQGDEVITPPNSFIASTAAIVELGARPVFVDVTPDQNIDPTLIEGAITPHTKAIMPVHLTGRMADMLAIHQLADRYGIPIIEDAAQAAGSLLHKRPSGSWGTVGCFSAHPLKNLNACDAGFITTINPEIANKVRLMRNHGLVDRDTVNQFGCVSRMDEVQAAILRYRLKRLPTIIQRRRSNVELYRSILDKNFVFNPLDKQSEFNSWHTFVIQVDRRNQLQKYLLSRRIQTAIHYPVPIHLQPACRSLGYQIGDFPETEKQATYILTLPDHQYLTESQLHWVAKSVNEFVGA